jgi:hypothetical protein
VRNVGSGIARLQESVAALTASADRSRPGLLLDFVIDDRAGQFANFLVGLVACQIGFQAAPNSTLQVGGKLVATIFVV